MIWLYVQARVHGIARHLPRAPLPARVLPVTGRRRAPPGPALPGLRRSYWLMRPTKSLHPALLGAPPAGLCRLLQAPAGSWWIPTLSPRSVCGCLDPYPAVPMQCLLVSSCMTSASPQTEKVRRTGQPPRRDFYGDRRFRGCSHSLMFRLPHLLGPRVTPTAGSLQGSWAVYTAQ